VLWVLWQAQVDVGSARTGTRISISGNVSSSCGEDDPILRIIVPVWPAIPSRHRTWADAPAHKQRRERSVKEAKSGGALCRSRRERPIAQPSPAAQQMNATCKADDPLRASLTVCVLHGRRGTAPFPRHLLAPDGICSPMSMGACTAERGRETGWQGGPSG
jgi:hypothetical protein